MAVVVKVGEVARSGERANPVQEYGVNGTPTVENALRAAGIRTKDLTSQRIRVNGEPASLASEVSGGDQVLVMPAIRSA